jgi:hypothetical protein
VEWRHISSPKKEAMDRRYEHCLAPMIRMLISKEGGFIMVVLNFVIAIVALIIAVLAFQRTGGTKKLKKNTAELLAKMEKRMREEAGKAEKEKTQQ